MKRTLLTVVTLVAIQVVANARVDAEDAGPSADSITPFRIHVDETTLVDLRQRLAATRWPDQIAGSGWEYGVDVGYMRQLVEYWRTDYDWRRQERALNDLPQFTTEIDGIRLHFIHVRSSHPDALPLLLVHGWPGSVYEFHKLIPLLTEPEKHGGRDAKAFHIVAPSLPGFGFSSAPRERGWNSSRMAAAFAKLMARLEYEHYGAQGGDWGGGIVRWLMTNDAAHCVAAHSNFPTAQPPSIDRLRGVTEAEEKRFQQRVAELADHKAYAAIQGTRPLTLAYGLNDSPAGLAAWITDKFWAWSDHDGSLENSFTKDELLTNITIYWVTGTMSSATRIYFESQHDIPRTVSMNLPIASGKPAPLGFALFPKEINLPPRAWVERSLGAPVAHWTEMPRGGHFAALEQPQLLANDIEVFFERVCRE